MQKCLVPLRNDYWKEKGGEDALARVCKELGYEMGPSSRYHDAIMAAASGESTAGVSLI